MSMVIVENENEQKSSKSLSDSLDQLLKSEVATDVTFLLGPKKEIVLAHKIILMSRSEIFFESLGGTMAKAGGIVIDEFDKAEFTTFLRYLYTDHLDFDENKIAAVYALAEKYSVDVLTDQIIEDFREKYTYRYSRSSKHTDNVLLILKEAYSRKLVRLKTVCLDVIFKDPKNHLRSSGFENLPAACVKIITESSKLSVEDEEDVFSAVIRWSEAECKRQNLENTDSNKRQVLGDILYTIRFSYMDELLFVRHVCSTEILTSDEVHCLLRSHQKTGNSVVTKFESRPRKNQRRHLSERAVRFSDISSLPSNSYSSILLTFTVSRRAKLHGLCIYACSEKTGVIKIKNLTIRNGQFTGRKDYKAWMPVNPHDKILDVQLDTCVDLSPDRHYTIECSLESPGTYYGINEKKLINIHGITVDFGNKMKEKLEISRKKSTSEAVIAGILLCDIGYDECHYTQLIG